MQSKDFLLAQSHLLAGVSIALWLCSFFDVSLGEKASRRDNPRQRKGFDFVKAGVFQKTAEQQRLKVRHRIQLVDISLEYP